MSQKIAVVGLGSTGLSCVNFLLKQGKQVTVFDTRQSPPGEQQLPESVPLVKGELDKNQLAQFTLIIASPGVALSTPALQFADASGCKIIGDIELFAKQLEKPQYQHAKLVTITGSNGKSTVTSLLGYMAEQAQVNVAVGGNIGVPALDLLSPEIDLYILELSSFQLETTQSLDADVATILNVSEDHLDRYNSYAHYCAAKHCIYDQTKMALFNLDDPLTYPKNKQLKQCSFGFENADYSLVNEQNGAVYLAKNSEPFLAVNDLKLSGKHNWTNALAAVALGEAVALDKSAMLKGLQEYTGLAHRCEFIADVNGVRWINDSKATNVGATQAALLGLSDTIRGDVHVILGGDGKGANFSELYTALSEIHGEIICFGVDAQKIAVQNERAIIVHNLEQAVDLLTTKVKVGDLVILSPACASLDMYKNFIARGDHFKSLVNSLAVGKC
jgi:UDP-N-acetylmuramoylalanine--D-glutamate ligase